MTQDHILTTFRLDSLQTVYAVGETLQRIDPRLMDHGERVAFIACELLEEGSLPLEADWLFLLSVFHDIGAYKTDEIDRLVEFETSDVRNHAVYGYLFLKHLSPLSEMAGAILGHHTPWPELERSGAALREYSALIHLADRMDIVFLNRKNRELANALSGGGSLLFKPEHISLAMRAISGRRLFERLADGSYKQTNRARFERMRFSQEAALEYLRMLVFSIDFRSEYTVTHTANTVSIALDAAQHFGLDKSQQERIYLGALLHDAGKISIPVEILEKPGRLTAEQMDVMRTHVSETEHIIRSFVPEDVLRIATRHHEKLDGSGYPHGLSGAELSFPERIVAVADVISALVSKRSYKEPFPKEKTIAVLREMSDSLLDGDVCAYVCADYDSIMERTGDKRNAVITKYQAMLGEYAALR